jgi:hypothetical protein
MTAGRGLLPRMSQAYLNTGNVIAGRFSLSKLIQAI